MTNEELLTRKQQISELITMLARHYDCDRSATNREERLRREACMAEDYIAGIVDIDMAIMFRQPRRLDTIEKLASDRVECKRLADAAVAYQARKDAAKADNDSLYALKESHGTN